MADLDLTSRQIRADRLGFGMKSLGRVSKVCPGGECEFGFNHVLTSPCISASFKTLHAR